MEVEVDRRGITALAAEPHVPTAQLGLVLDVLDRLHLADRTEEVPIDEGVGLVDHRQETGSRDTRSVSRRRRRAAVMVQPNRRERSSAVAPMRAARW